MGKQCQICISERRFEIEQKILQGQPLTTISQEFNISYESLHGHKSNGHIPKSLIQVQERTNLAERFNILNELEEIVNRTKDIFNRAYADEKYHTALKALDSQRGSYDILCKMLSLYQQTLQLENENLRLKAGDNNTEIQAEERKKLTRQLKSLTESELKVLIMIQSKAENDTKEVIIKDCPEIGYSEKLTDMLKHPNKYIRIG